MRIPFALILALAACTGDQRPEAQALELFEAGRAQLERGEHGAAAESFRLAVETDPRRTVLRSWQAYALAQGGDPTAAIALLEGEGVLGLAPHDRYNMAAWHTRLGDHESALSLLAAALDDEPELRITLGGDPDFEPLRADGSLASRIHDSELRAVMLGEEGAILAGEIYDLELNVQPGSVAVQLVWDRALPEGFTLTRVIDERSSDPGHADLRALRYGLRVGRGGEGTLGPWTLSSAQGGAPIPEVPWQAVVPAGVELGPVEVQALVDPQWWTPREALEGLEPATAVARHGLLVVCYLPGDRVEVEDGAVAGPPLEFELRQDGLPTMLAEGWRWSPASTGAAVTLTRKGSTVLDARVERGED